MAGDGGISVVVPVYNSHQTVAALVERVCQAVRALGPFELVLVNDGSRDASWQAIEAASAARPEVRGLDLGRNFGQHNALLCGIRHARYAVVVTLDDDLQNPPEEIPKLLAALAAGADVVYGTPEREQHGWFRDRASVLTKLTLRHVMGTEHARSVSAFRAFKTPLRAAFAEYRGPQVNIDVLLSWATTQFAAVPVQHAARQQGRSTYTLRKLVRHALNMITGFSVAPLRVASLIGFAFTACGLLLLLFVVGRYFIQGAEVPGFAFLASAISIFSGVQLFALGVMGEYLARMHYRLMDRPAYVVRAAAEGGGGGP
jgi:glycosyltransferase involved in cell wall biosynthesis